MLIFLSCVHSLVPSLLVGKKLVDSLLGLVVRTGFCPWKVCLISSFELSIVAMGQFFWYCACIAATRCACFLMGISPFVLEWGSFTDLLSALFLCFWMRFFYRFALSLCFRMGFFYRFAFPLGFSYGGLVVEIKFETLTDYYFIL